MKKLFTTLIIAATMTVGAVAQNYVIYGAGEPDDTRIGIGNINPWGNCSVEELTGDEYPGGKAMKYHVENDASYFIAGWFTDADFDYSPIVSGDYELVFDFKTNIPETSDVCIKIEAEGVDETPFEVARDNGWHNVRMNMKEKFPGFSAKMRVISLVGKNNVTGSEACIANIRIEKARQFPSIEATVSDVTMNSATLGWTIVIPDEYKDEPAVVKLDGETVDGSSKTFEGLAPLTTYKHTIELSAGEFVTSKTVSFTTLRDPSTVAIWYGSGESNGYAFDYELTANPDNTLGFEVAVNPAFDGVVRQVCVNGEWIDLKQSDAGDNTHFEVTTATTYTEGQELSIFLYFPPCRVDVVNPVYEFGAANEAPKELKIKSSVENITETSAEIAYTVIVPPMWNSEDVKVTLDGTPVSGSPVRLENLVPATAYSHVLRAEIVADGTTYFKEQTVDFTTLRPEGQTLVHYQIINKLIENAPVSGTDKRGGVAVSAWIKAEYNADRTLTYTIDIKGGDRIVGFVPSMLIDGGNEVVLNNYRNEDGTYTYKTARTYTDGQKIGNTYFRFAYAGGFSDLTLKNFTPSDESDMVAELAYGEPASIEIVRTQSFFKVGTEYNIPINVMDNQGNYILGGEFPEITGEGLSIVSGEFVTGESVGNRVVRATLGAIVAEQTLPFIDSDSFEATQGDNVKIYAPTANNIMNAFDGNIATEAVFQCSATEEHEIIVDLGVISDVHGIELIWEGASAKDYELTLHVAKDCSWYEGADKIAKVPRHRAAAADTPFDNMGAEPVGIYTVTDGDGGAGKNVVKSFGEERLGSPARVQYVRLATTKATDATWGIKLSEMHILATAVPQSDIETGVGNVAVESGYLVDVYNMMGVKVLDGVRAADVRNLVAPGVYIVGGTKVFVK